MLIKIRREVGYVTWGQAGRRPKGIFWVDTNFKYFVWGFIDT